MTRNAHTLCTVDRLQLKPHRVCVVLRLRKSKPDRLKPVLLDHAGRALKPIAVKMLADPVNLQEPTEEEWVYTPRRSWEFYENAG